MQALRRQGMGGAEEMRPDWDTYFLGIAEAVSVRGDCTRRQIGAVITSPEHLIIALGYNGTAPGLRGCLDGGCPRGRHYELQNPAIPGAMWGICKCSKPFPCPDYVEPGASYNEGPGRCIAQHAELNACVKAGYERARGCTIYITDAPCYGCIKVIRSAGIVRIVHPQEGRIARFDFPFGDV